VGGHWTHPLLDTLVQYRMTLLGIWTKERHLRSQIFTHIWINSQVVHVVLLYGSFSFPTFAKNPKTLPKDYYSRCTLIMTQVCHFGITIQLGFTCFKWHCLTTSMEKTILFTTSSMGKSTNAKNNGPFLSNTFYHHLWWFRQNPHPKCALTFGIDDDAYIKVVVF
jgi:hypothetical protein